MPAPQVSPSSRDPRYTSAMIDPLTLRYLAMVAEERGVATASLLRGLGFGLADLQRPGFRISYRQGSLMIQRAYQLLADPGLGLTVGSRETPVSWGLVGFGMMSCATLQEATEFGLRFQKDAGSLAHITHEVSAAHVTICADPMFYDPDIEVFLVEEIFSAMVNVARHLVSASFAPARVELIYQRPAHYAQYEQLFRCPVAFGCARNRLVIDLAWMARKLPTHDALVAQTVRELIERNLQAERLIADFGATIERAIRENLKALPPLGRLAKSIHMSERTLRRKLTETGISYQSLVESVRKARALELLSHSTLSVTHVAAETGFSDVRNFRKAFKRWTGSTPTEIREKFVAS